MFCVWSFASPPEIPLPILLPRVRVVMNDEIEIHRQSRHVPQKQMDGSASFQRTKPKQARGEGSANKLAARLVSLDTTLLRERTASRWPSIIHDTLYRTQLPPAIAESAA